MTEWYIELLGQPVGPMTGKQLLDRVRLGEIVADTPIRKDDSQWVPARDVGGLFAAAGGDQKRDVTCPYCGATTDLPPTRCAKCRRQVEQVYELVLGPSAGASPPADEPTASEDPKSADDDQKVKRKGRLFKGRKQQD